MANQNPPTILYPTGGETILTPTITIQWSAANPDEDNRTFLYEIYFEDYYNSAKEPDWKQIASLPSVFTQFTWRPVAIRSSNCRIAIRTVNSRGERSQFAITNSNFSIQRRRLTVPSVVVPVPNQIYDQYISLQVDDTAIVNTYSQRTYYQFYYSSVKANVPYTPIQQDVPIGSDPVLWNIINLQPADDYIVDIFLQDDDGNTSDHLYIPIQISHEGYFILDTQPPVSSITINNGSTFTRSRDVSVQIVSYDATTGIQSMLLESSDGTSGSPDSVGNVRSYTLSTVDGFKDVELLLQDFGGNRNDQIAQRLFQNVIELDGTVVTDIAIDNSSGTVWAVTSGSGNYLYKYINFPSRQTTFANTPTAIGIFESQPYIATKDANNNAVLIKWTTLQEVVYTFTEQDSVINCMELFNDELFIGMENGNIYSYNSAAFVLVQTMTNPIRDLVSDGSQLYAVLKNDLNVYVFNGSQFIGTSS